MKKLFIYLINIVIIAFLLFVVLYKPGYMVSKPGGIENIEKSYTINGKGKINGSVNITYTETVKPNLLYYWYAKLKHYNITKIEDYAPNGLDIEKTTSNLMYLSSINNAIYNAYKYTGNEIETRNEKIYIDQNLNPDSPLMEGDLILEINDQKIDKLELISTIINSVDTDTVKVKYQRGENVLREDVKLINKNGINYLGITTIDTFDYYTNPRINFSIKDDVAGPSGGAMMALAVYATLSDEDIIHGLKIAGSGTINRDGEIGPIGGIEYKIKSALKSDVDVFFVPKYINYYEVLDMDVDFKDMKIVPIDTFEDIINYLKENK